MKNQKFLSIILAIVIFSTTLFTVTSTADTSAHSGFKNMKKLSKAEIVRLTTDEKLNDYMNFYVSKPSVTSPYSMGEVRADMQQAALDRFNAYRRLAGLGSVLLDSSYTTYAQAAAVVNAANDVMSHYPVQPDGMPDDLYKTGAYGASHSNIADYMGYRPEIGPLSFSVDMWMEDSDRYNITQLGHRRWMLNPIMGKTGFGCATSASDWVHTAVYAFDNSAADYDYDFISWPPSGYMVNDTEFFTTAHAWSISLNPSEYDIGDLSQVDVELKDENGNDWSFNGNTDDDGFFNIDLGGYGSNRNAIIFKPDGIQKYEGIYTVTVEGLITKSGKATTLTYEVEFFGADEANTPVTTTAPTTAPVTTTESTTIAPTTTTEPTTIAPTTTTEPSTAATTQPPTTTTEPDSSIPEPNSSEIFETTTEKPPVTEHEVMKGDVSGDRRVNASDARLALRISAKLDTPTIEEFKAADVNSDGKINASDARTILRVAAKLDVFETETENITEESANDNIATTTAPEETTTAAQITTTKPSTNILQTTTAKPNTTAARTTTKPGTTVAQTTSAQAVTTKPQPSNPTDMAVIITSTGDAYHDLECELLLSDAFDGYIYAVTKTNAEQMGYEPCKTCLET